MKDINIYSEDKVISRVLVRDGFDDLESSLACQERVFAVVDANVVRHCSAYRSLQSIFNSLQIPVLQIEVSEDKKDIASVMAIISFFLTSDVDRSSLVLAVGGGITTDMVGFAASIYKRGVKFAFVPTTLLAQVDAAIGGKTGVNYDGYKNMIGVIAQPYFTYICPAMLDGLSRREFLCGAAELLKTFVIEDNGNYDDAVKFLTWLYNRLSNKTLINNSYVTGLQNDLGLQNGLGVQKDQGLQESQGVQMGQGEQDNDQAQKADQGVKIELSENERAMLCRLIAAAAAVKAKVVTHDQFEKGERRKLNFGHTFAHAIEKCAHNASISIMHGEAVAMGMILAARVADRISGTALEERFLTDFRACGLPVECPFEIEQLAGAMLKDKKMENGILHFVIARSIGDTAIYDISVPELIKMV